MAFLSRFEFSASLNVFSGYVTTVWSVLLQLCLIPFYVKVLGAEGYGLIGFYATLQGLLLILDFGLTPTVSREVARSSASAEQLSEVRDLVKTLECLYWFLAIVTGLGIMFLAPVITGKWLSVQTMPLAEAESCIVLMGLASVFQWPLGFFTGGLQGLQRQGLINTLNVVFNTILGLGAVAILLWVSPSTQAFFLWRAAVALVQVGVARFVFWRLLLPAGKSPPTAQFRLSALAPVWRFASGMAGISVFGNILTQVDKIVLSRVLSIGHFGFYMLAVTISGLLPQLLSPITAVVSPLLARLVAEKNEEGQCRETHFNAQFMGVVAYPVAITLTLFSYPFLLLWTRNEAAAAFAAPVLSLLAIGYLLNSIMLIPFHLQLAHGWTSLALMATGVLTCLMVPYTIIMGTWYGAVGAASNLVVLNLLGIAITVPPTFRCLIPGQGKKWLLEDLAIPLVSVFLAVWLIREMVPDGGTRVMMALKLLLALLASGAVAITAAGEIRQKILSVLPTSR